MTVALINHMGDDLSIVNAARVSYDKESRKEAMCDQCGTRESEGVEQQGYLFHCSNCHNESYKLVLRKSDKGLINFLMRNRHGTPFEMVQLQLRINVPIFVAREWQRHRIGSYSDDSIGSFNERSTRYVEMQPEFYTPLPEHIRVQVGKVGNYTYEPAGEELAKIALMSMNAAHTVAYNTYEHLLKLGVAKEVARDVLPLSLMTEFIWSVNLRSLFNFVSLRNHDRALFEIQLEAKEVERLATTIVPCAMEAFEKNGRVAP